jgi:hypothetical protein
VLQDHCCRPGCVRPSTYAPYRWCPPARPPSHLKRLREKASQPNNTLGGPQQPMSSLRRPPPWITSLPIMNRRMSGGAGSAPAVAPTLHTQLLCLKVSPTCWTSRWVLLSAAILMRTLLCLSDTYGGTTASTGFAASLSRDTVICPSTTTIALPTR